jgi:hypothetical protein
LSGPMSTPITAIRTTRPSKPNGIHNIASR